MVGRDSILAGGISIQLVDSYLHVGDVINASGTMLPVINHRSASLGMTCAPFRKTVVAKTSLFNSQLVNLAHSLLVSSLLFNSHTWCGLKVPDCTKLQSRLACAYGSTIRGKVFDLNGTVLRLSDNDVFAQVNRGDAAFQLRASPFFGAPFVARISCYFSFT